MSHLSTPFIVINLGCEMIYVIEQRLKVQSIPAEKSEKVLTDLVTVLLHPNLLEELFLPQPVAPHCAIKQLIADISASSIMKLDEYSINKLWDLITMIFKWQITVASATNQNIFHITRHHIKCVATLMPHYFPKNIIKDALNKFEVLSQKVSDYDFKCLINTVTLWFCEYNTKISVLLRLDLQQKDGTFRSPSKINTKYLKNIGENIYKYDCKKESIDDYRLNFTDDGEISCLLAPFETVSPKKKEISLVDDRTKIAKASDNIELNRKNIYVNDLHFITSIPKSTQEDLLDLLDDSSPLN